MPNVTVPVNLNTEIQPGKTRDPYLMQQTSQIQAALNQALTEQVRSTGADYTASIYDWYVMVNTTPGNIIITLPAAANSIHRVTVKKADSSGNSLTIVTRGTETIDGAASVTTSTAWDKFSFASDGKNWFTV